MKKLLLSFTVGIMAINLSAQTIVCNPAGNLIIYTNYDGGHLSINVDANIPNLKIGIVSYEPVTVLLGGAYVNNVTEVAYAGYNGTNGTNCGAAIPATTITGAPSGVTPTITSYPPSPLSNPNGYGSIICGYSCSTTSNQGGCNTVDQIEAYFMSIFSGAVLYAHDVQYSCWTTTQSVAAGGTCCSPSVGIDNTLTDNIFSVFPNPASDMLNVKINKSSTGAVYSIQNLMGQTVLTGKLIDEQSTIKINQLPAGVYLFKIGELTKQTFKVVKE